MDLSVRTLAITAKPNASRAEASSQSSSPRTSMLCRTSTALRTTTGLILEFFLRAPGAPDGRFYTSTGLSAGLNLSWAMIQEDYGAYVAASVGQELLSGRFAHEAVNHEVRVPEISRHRPASSNAPDEDARTRTRNVELNDGAVLIAHKAVIRIGIVNIPSRDRAICVDSKGVGTVVHTRDVTGVRRVERGEGAIRIHQETVTQIVRVEVISHDGSTRSK